MNDFKYLGFFELLGRGSGPSKSQGNALSPSNFQMPLYLGEISEIFRENERGS